MKRNSKSHCGPLDLAGVSGDQFHLYSKQEACGLLLLQKVCIQIFTDIQKGKSCGCMVGKKQTFLQSLCVTSREKT